MENTNANANANTKIEENLEENLEKNLEEKIQEKNTYILSKKEEEIMMLFWQENRELSSSDIIHLSPNKTWKASSIFILLNSLLKKGAIEMAGFIKSQTNYGRTFKYITTENEYTIMQIKKVFQKSNISSLEVITELIKEQECIESIGLIENLLNDQKNYLKNKNKDLL
ncbi:MAG: BlaI/MecI/CopY family transcriptional regulator [bacterium]